MCPHLTSNGGNKMIDLLNDTYIIISGEAGYHAAQLTGTDLLGRFLGCVAQEVEHVTGKYNTDDSIERAVIAKFADVKEAERQGTIWSGVFGQDSFVLSDSTGRNTLVFPRDRSQDVTGHGVTWYAEEPENFYSTLADGRHFSLCLDF